MRYATISWILICLLLSAGACRLDRPVEVQPSFYHWQSRLAVDSLEGDLLRNLGVRRLYVRFFDVDWDAAAGELRPHSVVSYDGDSLPGVEEIIPTVFLTNRSFLKSTPAQQEELVGKLLQKVDQLSETLPPEVALPFWQIDCDWTGSSRAAFFHFLELLRERLHRREQELSVTIRLHQFADPVGTGLPPADHGVLMFYNMGDLNSWQEENSILNLPAALPYLSGRTSYPMDLDLALPVYSWGVLYRDGRLQRLVNDLQVHDLRDTSYFRQLSPFRFIVTKSTYLQGQYVYRDDLIRVEAVQLRDLERALELLQPVFGRRDHSLILYHLDAALLKSFSHAELEALFH